MPVVESGNEACLETCDSDWIFLVGMGARLGSRAQ